MFFLFINYLHPAVFSPIEVVTMATVFARAMIIQFMSALNVPEFIVNETFLVYTVRDFKQDIFIICKFVVIFIFWLSFIFWCSFCVES